MRTVWIPEAPGYPGLYANLSDKTMGGYLGESQPSTRDETKARQFETEEECQKWCADNPHPVFVSIEHGFYDETIGGVPLERGPQFLRKGQADSGVENGIYQVSVYDGWHDLREDPEDLPLELKEVFLLDGKFVDESCLSNGLWRRTRVGYINPIAWRYKESTPAIPDRFKKEKL